MDVHLTDTYFVVAHFHYVMVGGMVMAYLGALHFWWPKITGKMYPGGLGKVLRPAGVRRIQPDLLPAVHLGYLGSRAAIMPMRRSSRCST
jgi:cytochrome c oxidase subunit 1